MKEVWIIGTIVGSGWMVEGIFEKEEDAIKNVKHKSEFVVLVNFNKRLPKTACKAKKLYFPLVEKWTESKLYKYKQKRRK